MAGELDYIFILKALKEIPFGVGKKLLSDFLQGDETNQSIIRNRLHYKENFASLMYEKEEIEEIIESLLLNGMIKYSQVGNNRFYKVLELTKKGIEEIDSPTLHKKKLSNNFKQKETTISKEEKELFRALDSFLSQYNDEQKKAIISGKNNILCIAGAGSGKTTVLTKRIEFLIKYRSVNPKKILAITFTRKARKEMIKRLSTIEQAKEVNIETFNSFCEKILRKYESKAYNRKVRVLTYKDKITIIKKALSIQKLDMKRAISLYFSPSQVRSKTKEQLANIFLNDCFFIRDYFKFKNKKLEEESFKTTNTSHKKSAELVFSVSNYIEAYMTKNGLRDFADQLIDTLSFLNKNKELIPEFNHVLIDEYQDINSTQIKLIDLLNPKNIFCVGDPRQSIYGWRGSDIKYILNFNEKYPDCEEITLTKNYRSEKHIVKLINDSIKNMGLPDIEAVIKEKNKLNMISLDSEEAEFDFIIKTIKKSKTNPKEIFVLARTNRQLNELSKALKKEKIKHIIRSDELKKSITENYEGITLATIHAIKGLEAELVFVIGCTGFNFPCKASEHPVIDMVKVDEYDIEEEERRLFYVAMSRAKKELYLTYPGKKHTYFITSSMIKIIEEQKEKTKDNFSLSSSSSLVSRLKEWRKNISKKDKIPAFMILHDRTLIDIAVNMPMTKTDLEKIMGMGPAKIQKYGTEILDLVCS